MLEWDMRRVKTYIDNRDKIIDGVSLDPTLPEKARKDYKESVMSIMNIGA